MVTICNRLNYSGWRAAFLHTALPFLIISCGFFFLGCQKNNPPAKDPHVEKRIDLQLVPAASSEEKRKLPATLNIQSPLFVNVADQIGISFRYDNGAIEKALMTESTGGGVGWLDYDRDGWQDLFFVQGGNPLNKTPHTEGDQLFRNRGEEAFENVSLRSLPSDMFHGQGVAIADYDNDGFPDIYVTNVGANVLWKNNGDGSFSDVTEYAQVGDTHWSTSAAWADLDLDGDLDLYVCNYTVYDVHDPVPCMDDDGKPIICHPQLLEAENNSCYENLGDGTFRPILNKWGLEAEEGKSLGVIAADFDRDGLIDLFVANDVTPNHLFRAVELGKFVEEGVIQGCAMSSLGKYQASMGVACGDYDNNGYPDLYVSHFTDDSNTLYQNLRGIGFRDVTRLVQLHTPTLEFLAFGAMMTDFNFDGRMDLVVANGHIDDWRDRGDAWKMTGQVFTFNGKHWQEVTKSAGNYFKIPLLGRAIAQADYDNDGSPDLAIVNQNEPAALLHNEQKDGHWLKVQLVGISSNRAGLGATVELKCNNNIQVQQLISGESYCASHEPVLFFGLGNHSDDCEILVHWLQKDHPIERWQVKCDQFITLIEGQGEPHHGENE